MEENNNIEEIRNASTAKGVVVSISPKREYRPGSNLLEFRLRTDDAYPQVIEFVIYDKGISKFEDKIAEGNTLGIRFNIKAREYNDNFYYSLVPWSVELLQVLAVASSDEPKEDEVDESDVPF
jgi:hypothetical protein